jgi:TolB-like protein/multisubunit Na+/H+ antiporter MnhF subunit
MKIFEELKRRNVFRVGIAYLIGAWLFTQVADVVLGIVSAPESAMRAVAVILALGFIPTVIFAWVYEMTPEGVKKASEVNLDQSITHQTGKKLDIATMIMLVSVVALVVVERYLPGDGNNDRAGAETAAEMPADVVSAPAESNGKAPASPVTAIAVLPFANRSNREDDLYFTDGIHDDLLTHLSKVGGLKVISRTSVMEYRNSPKNLKEIGAELNVGTILEGGVQKVGERVRINAQLIEVATDQHLWAETFDRELTAENVFDLQSEIARKIVGAVAIQLSPEEEALLDDIPTQNLAAYEAYLRARELINSPNYTRAAEQAAKPFLEMAIDLDPEYSDAYALLSHVYGQEYWRGIETSPEFLETYRATIDRAVELKPGSPQALRAQANYYYRVENDWQRSLELLQAALASAPGDPDINADIALSQRRLGRWEDSVASFKRSLENDPANRFNFAALIGTMTATHQWQAIVDMTESLDDADPDDLDVQVMRALALMNLTGDLEPIKRVFRKMNLVYSSHYTGYSAYVHWLSRDPDMMLEVLNGPVWREAIAESSSNSFFHTIQVADAWRLKGDQDRANAFYQQVVDRREEAKAGSGQVRFFNMLTVATAMAFLERFEEAHEILAEVAEDSSSRNDAMIWGWLAWSRALVRGLAGDHDGAIDDIRLALSTPLTQPFTAWDLHYDPNWDFLRDDPRFVELATPDNLIQ